MRRGRSRFARLRVVAVAAVACCLVPAAALAAFPGADPGESPRANTPDDPDFDPCEADDENPSGPACTSYFSEEYRLFGFSPDTANALPLAPRALGATTYADCSQLDAQGRAANLAAGDPECAQIGGVRADTAWKYSTGDPEVAVAILDTGIRWQERELVDKVRLNAAELPTPQVDGPAIEGADCGAYTAADDANGDGAFNVRDFACDPRLQIAAGDTESDSILDASDLIAGFSDGTDADANGYADDIAGWDFFDDDNDPFDASSCCSANGHGTGRAREAVAATDNGVAGAGLCPECQVIPIRIWDTFVTPGDNFAMGVVYAADNGASVVEGAVGGLTNTRFARRAAEYADSRGLALTFVSSDINSANHNYPTNYKEAIYVGGSLPDTAPYETCGGLGLPLIGDIVELPPELEDGCADLLGTLGDLVGLDLNLQPPTTSFFRNSNLTQYGGKADVVLMGATGSENTGQASGAAALLASYGREVFGDADPLSGNEIRQLLTMTAEDVLPQNTGTIGPPDKANPGWDPHFGYGRVNLAAAMARIEAERIPPEAQIDSPDWFAPVNVDRLPADGLEVHGRAAAPHGAGVGDWELEYACGADALDTAFTEIATGTGSVDGALATIPKATLEDLADNCDGSVANDFGRPVGALTDALSAALPLPGVNPYPEPDPERHSVQLRLTVHEEGDADNVGRYRKTIFPYRDDGNLQGWPRPLGSDSHPQRLIAGSGGEVPPRMYDLDGDNALDLIQGTSSGELHVLDAAGEPLESFNAGQPVLTRPLAIAAAHGVPGATGGLPRETLRAPAIGDIDGDLEPEIVATAGEHVYAWERDGAEVAGFPARVDPALSEPCAAGVEKPCFDAADRVIDSGNHVKRGFFGSPALADLDQDPGGDLEIVAGSLDQHVYAWDGDGTPLDGFPAKVASAGAPGAEIVTSPSIAQLDGEGPPEIVLASNELIPGDPEFPEDFANDLITFNLLNLIFESGTGSNPVYALHADGTPVDGWPVTVGAAAGDLLPMVLPGHDAAAFDADGDGTDEVVVSAATSLGAGGGVRVVDGTGATTTTFNSAVGTAEDPTPVLNLADYPVLGSLTADDPPSVVKGGLTLNGAVNLLAPNQNLPFAHVVQAWSSESGAPLPGYPRPSDDFQLVSQPAIAKVDGEGSGRQTLFGTGLYQLHAYGADGLEPESWPKFLGGWVQATPTVGDADGDGDLDVSALTREGWSFLWSTDAPACDLDGTSTNDEWWTFHHDEHGTANRGHDARPPGTATGLAAAAGTEGATELSWTAPGDDWLCGEAERFRVVVGDGPIDSPGDGATAIERDASGPAGTEEQATLTAAERGAATHAAVFYRDDAGNWGLVRGVALPAAPGPGPGPGSDPQPGDRPCATAIAGTGDADKLAGGPASERIKGRGGNDRIKGRGGDDCLAGQGGADRISGGAGDDELRGGRGNDRLRGGSGDDLIRVHRGARDRVDCGPGDDRVILNRKRDRAGRNCERLTFARGR